MKPGWHGMAASSGVSLLSDGVRLLVNGVTHLGDAVFPLQASGIWVRSACISGAVCCRCLNAYFRLRMKRSRSSRVAP